MLIEFLAPQLLPSFRDQINQNVGNKFRLVCSIQKGIEPLEFEWFRNGIRLITQTSNVHLEFGDDFSNLIITKLSELDSGNYTCRVQNNYGSDQFSVQLNVEGVIILQASNSFFNFIAAIIISIY